MNIKTTLILAILVAVVAVSAYVANSKPRTSDMPTAEIPKAWDSPIARKLLEEKELGDIVKVACERKGLEPWVFERPGASEAGRKWGMTKPQAMKILDYEVERLASGLKSVLYEITYKPGQAGGVTASAAGLEPPEATVTLTDADNREVVFEIGKAASDQTTYLRRKGKSEFVAAKLPPRGLLKNKMLEWCDQQVCTFPAEKATRAEIVDRSDSANPTTYVLVKDGARWMFESPVAARATAKVDDMIRTMSRLRVTQWTDDRADKLAAYGFEPASWTIRVTVTEEVPTQTQPETSDDAQKADGEEDKPKTEPKVTVHELQLSDRTPIGEDAKFYVRAGSEPVVGVVIKATADKFKPVMNEWREMRLTTANVTNANQVEISGKAGAGAMVKKDGHWSFEADGGKADDKAVAELLKAVGELNAVAFLEAQPSDEAAYGFADPQAELRLTIPGADGVERITIGGYTDPKSNLLVFARRNAGSTIAKIRTENATTLLRGPDSYRDKTVFEVSPARFERVTLSTDDPVAGGRRELTFEQKDGAWTMTAPVQAAVRAESMQKLVDALGTLKAEAVISQGSDASAYGLTAPSCTVSFTYKPPVEYRVEAPQPTEAKEGEEPLKAVTIEVQPPSQTLSLRVSRHDGKVYAQRADRPTIYAAASAFHDLLIAEYRTTEVLTFDDAKVTLFSVRSGSQTHAFEKRDGKWKYQPEPDLPLDAKKVTNLLLQIKDLRTERYVSYSAADAQKFGLSTPEHEVTVTLKDGAKHVLKVSAQSPPGDASKGMYASVAGRNEVFLLTPETIARFKVSLKDLE